MSVNWLFEKGGLVMGPLAAVSVLGVAVFLERLFYLLLAPRGARELAERVAERILTDGIEAARAEAARASGPVARMLHEGLSLGETDPEVTEKLLSFAAERELESLSRGFGFLALMANVAPLLGLLGTVLGMIRAFQTVEALGARVTPSDLAGGIWEAMLTTAVGLTVAIPLMVGLSLLEGRLARIRAELEEAGAVVLKALHERTRHA